MNLHLACLGPLWLAAPLLFATACDEKNTLETETSQPSWNVADETMRAVSGPSYRDEDFSFEASAPELCQTRAPMNPAEGHVRLSIPIKLAGLSQREVPVTAMSFTLSDQEGHTYRPTLAGCHPSLKSTALTNGDILKTHAAFDVPRIITQWNLTFHPFLLGRKEVRAEVELPLKEMPATPSQGSN